MLTNPNTPIETKTIIFGQDVADMKDADLIAAIKRLEGDVAKLKEVKTESSKIKSNIIELKECIRKIVVILDAR
jgi:hypothetical protein